MGMGSGTDARWKFLQDYATKLESLFRSATLPTVVDINLEGFGKLSSINNMFLAVGGAETVTIRNLVSNATNFTAVDLFYYTNSIKYVKFVDCAFSPQNWTEAFRSASIISVDGELDFSNTTNVTQMFTTASNLTEVRFKANTLKISMPKINDSPLLSNASLISIANGLNGSVTGQSIALHSTPKARCSTIMGENMSGTFIASDSGTLSLADFITTIKGWTIA